MNTETLFPISDREFREAAKAGKIVKPEAVPHGRGYMLTFKFKNKKASILKWRKDEGFREWVDLRSLVTHVKNAGLDKLEVRLN